MIIRADFTAGGLSCKLPCVYILTIRDTNKSYYYIGRTGTSNNTGMSSPYKRLAKHLAKHGNTQSCIWNADLPKSFLDAAVISFVALTFDEKDEAASAEDWLRWRFAGKNSLNKEMPEKEEPSVPAELRAKLTSLTESANSAM